MPNELYDLVASVELAREQALPLMVQGLWDCITRKLVTMVRKEDS